MNRRFCFRPAEAHVGHGFGNQDLAEQRTVARDCSARHRRPTATGCRAHRRETRRRRPPGIVANTSPPASRAAVGRRPLKRRTWCGPSALCVRPVSTTYSSDSSGENASPFGCTKSEATTVTRPLRRVDAVDIAGADFARRGVAFVVRVDAIARVGEPDAAVALDHDVVRRVEALAVVSDRPAPCACRRTRCATRSGSGVRTRRDGPEDVDRVAVAVHRRLAEHGHRAVRFRPSAACDRSGCRTRRGSARPRTTPVPRPSGSRCRASRREYTGSASWRKRGSTTSKLGVSSRAIAACSDRIRDADAPYSECGRPRP